MYSFGSSTTVLLSLYILFLPSAHCIDRNSAFPQCNAMIDLRYLIFDKCHDRELELASYERATENLVNISDISESIEIGESNECTDVQEICRKIFKVKKIRGKSFQTKMQVQISDMIFQCCGRCGKYYTEDTFDFDLESMRTFDIIFPVTARNSEVKRLYGYNYIPVFEVPSAYYITLHKSSIKLSLDLIRACLRLWPYFIGCILLSMVFGCVMWVFERRHNKSQFSNRFPRYEKSHLGKLA